MDKEGVKQKQQQHNTHNISNGNNRITSRERQIIGEGLMEAPQSADLVLRWGNRKRLRCMKIQVKDSPTSSSHRTTATVRRVIRSDTVIINNSNNNNINNNNGVGVGQGGCNGHFNLRQRSASPARPPLRSLRNNNTESGSGMKGHQGNGVRGVVVSPERGSGAHENNNNNNNGVRVTSSSDKGGSSSGGSDVVVWPPKFMIALTNKEKEEDFMAIKGSKLPQRPKKRAKFVQRTLNLVSPGGWLCDLTLERYEVREKKTSKKRPRGLKAMGNYIDSESE